MENEIYNQVVEIVTPFAKDKDALAKVTRESSFLKDLQVSSARLVDIILAIEDKFDIEINDDEADKVETVGLAVDLISKKKA
jgi:acyl carrier protein